VYFQQCDFLTDLAKKFKIRKDQLTLVIVEAIVNGTRTAAKIYDVTINALIEEAKDLKCNEMIDDSVSFNVVEQA